MIYGGIHIHIKAAWTLLLGIPKGRSQSQHNAHLEFHSRLRRARKLPWINDLVIFSAYHFIITPLDEMMSDGISAITLNNIIKILGCRDV